MSKVGKPLYQPDNKTVYFGLVISLFLLPLKLLSRLNEAPEGRRLLNETAQRN